LNSSTRNGASASTLLLSKRVGSGSEAHCLSGSERTAITTSSTVSWQNSRSRQSGGAVVNKGGGAS
jgi:hypothetical protein